MGQSLISKIVNNQVLVHIKNCNTVIKEGGGNVLLLDHLSFNWIYEGIEGNKERGREAFDPGILLHDVLSKGEKYAKSQGSSMQSFRASCYIYFTPPVT